MKKSQYTLMSLVATMAIFFGIIAVLTQFVIDNPVLSGRKYQTLKIEADYIMSQLITQGYPVDWNNETPPQRIGLTTEGYLDEVKVLAFLNMSYDNATYTLGTTKDIIITFDNNYSFFQFNSSSTPNITYVADQNIPIYKTERLLPSITNATNITTYLVTLYVFEKNTVS